MFTLKLCAWGALCWLVLGTLYVIKSLAGVNLTPWSLGLF